MISFDISPLFNIRVYLGQLKMITIICVTEIQTQIFFKK